VPKPQGVRLRHELEAFKNVQVLLAMAMTVLGFGGVFATITYIVPMMTHAAGFADALVTWLLVLFGLGLVAGNLVGVRHADRALMPMRYVSRGAGFGYTAPNWVGALLAGSALVPALLSAALERRRHVLSTVVAGGAMADRRTAVRR
jgi:predicted MFS family arabinose efflux permease